MLTPLAAFPVASFAATLVAGAVVMIPAVALSVPAALATVTSATAFVVVVVPDVQWFFGVHG